VIAIFLCIVIASTLSVLSWKRCYDWKDTRAILNDVIKKYPDSTTGNILLGGYFDMNNDYESAVREYNRAIQVDPGDAKPHAQLCELFLVQGSKKKALPYCMKAIDINPKMEVVYTDLGYIYWPDDKETSIKMYKKSLALKQNNIGALSNLCSMYMVLKQFEDAKPVCQGAVKINPKLAGAHNNLAIIYYLSQQYDLAIKHANLALAYGYKVHPEFLKQLENYRQGRK
jgi:tetratricopeptide (TPR) repeat protein